MSSQAAVRVAGATLPLEIMLNRSSNLRRQEAEVCDNHRKNYDTEKKQAFTRNAARQERSELRLDRDRDPA